MLIHALESNKYIYAASDVTNFKIIRENCNLEMVVSVHVDNTAGTVSMTLGSLLDKFLEDPSERKNIYNCVNIDFTFTELGKIFKSPDFVIKNYLVINNWPDIYKISQIYDINEYGVYNELHFPMSHQVYTISAKYAFSDFHIDFSGVNVWVTLLKGKKVWWLAPPTPENISLCESYLKDPSALKDIVMELVENYCRITLTAGQSLLLPSGWLHAVLTLEDSLMI
uniref:JmjC domain-containing protein n=1 Tax=Strongyloides papillosus TaxID=174720 RepID=A0A0N5BDK9_STREA